MTVGRQSFALCNSLFEFVLLSVFQLYLVPSFSHEALRCIGREQIFVSHRIAEGKVMLPL